MNIVFKGLEFTVSEAGIVGLTGLYDLIKEYRADRIERYAFPEFDVADCNLSGRYQKHGSTEIEIES